MLGLYVNYDWYMLGPGRDLIWSAIPKFASSDWDKPQNTSTGIAGLRKRFETKTLKTGSRVATHLTITSVLLLIIVYGFERWEKYI